MVAEEEGRRREERGERKSTRDRLGDLFGLRRGFAKQRAFDSTAKGGLRSQVIGKAVRACVRARLQAACVSTWYDLG